MDDETRLEFGNVHDRLDGVTSDIEHLAADAAGFHHAVDARFDAVDARFRAVDARFDAVDARFDAVDARFDAMDARFDSLLSVVERGFAIVHEDLTALRADLNTVIDTLADHILHHPGPSGEAA